MSERTGLSVALVGQAVFFGMVLATSGMLRTAFFGFFWVATLATLLIILTAKRWHATEWVVFGAFAASLITAVLLSSKSLVDVFGVSVPVIGLLCVAAAVSAIPDKRRSRRVATQEIIPDLIYSVPGSAKYHVRTCRMLKNKDDVQAFLTEDEARAQGKSRCGICF